MFWPPQLPLLVTRHFFSPGGWKKHVFAKRTQSCSMFIVEFGKIQSQLKPFQSQKKPIQTQSKANF
jgi:hypothetical protein